MKFGLVSPFVDVYDYLWVNCSVGYHCCTLMRKNIQSINFLFMFHNFSFPVVSFKMMS